MRRSRRGMLWRSTVTLAVAGAVVVARPGVARAEAPINDADLVDGTKECAAFDAKNERDVSQYEKTQPAEPYRYPREKMVLNAPWGNLFSNLGHTGQLVLATVIPHIGAQYRGDYPAALVSWPWTILVVGPMYSCSRKKNTLVVHGHRAHRLLVEPGVVSSKLGVGVSARVGYRFIWHPSSWVVGPGLGLGSTVEIAGNREPFRASIGPEALVHFGNCCAASYFTLAFRYDHYFAGNNRNIFGGSLGYTFF